MEHQVSFHRRHAALLSETFLSLDLKKAIHICYKLDDVTSERYYICKVSPFTPLDKKKKEQVKQGVECSVAQQATTCFLRPSREGDKEMHDVPRVEAFHAFWNASRARPE